MSVSDAYLGLSSLGQASTYMDVWKDARIFLGLPPFHAAGQIGLLAAAVPANTTLVMVPDVPMTAELVDAVHVHSNVQGTVLAPSLLEEIAKDYSYLENVSKLKWVSYGGGPLSKVKAAAYYKI